MSDQQSPSGQTWVCRAPVTVSGRCRPIGNFGPFHEDCGPPSSVPYVQDDLYDRMTRSPGPQPDGRWVEAIWHILVTEGGANAEDRDAFIAQWPDCVEYRFGGHLGSGGKVWAPGSKRSVPVVDFYPESSTVSRRAIAARINVHLCDAYVMAIALGSAAPPSTPVERPAAITDEMLRAAETHHGDSCSYCNSAADIDCPTAAILNALAATPAPGDNP